MYNNKGFTLIELMVTIAVAAIIMAIAVPSMQLMQANSRVSSAANELAADLKKVRNLAIVSRRNHLFSSMDSTATGNVWGKGWRAQEVFSAANSPDVFKTTTLPQSVTVDEAKTSVVFSGSTGMLQTAAALPTSMDFKVCDSQSSKETGYNVLINRFGRVLIQRHTSPVACNA